MEGPIVSIDVSNGNSHYMCFIKNNKRFGKVKKIDHDIEGFKRLLEDIQKRKLKPMKRYVPYLKQPVFIQNL